MLVTPSHVAPLASAARAAAAPPCPKPSALTTAITPARATGGEEPGIHRDRVQVHGEHCALGAIGAGFGRRCRGRA